MKRLIVLSAFAAVVICGCVPSIHGIATEENTVWSEQLLGKWGRADSANDPNAEVWEFQKGKEEYRYTLVHRDDDGKAGQFEVALVELGDNLFLDLLPGENDALGNANELYQMHVLAVHTFIRVDELGETLKMRMMDPDKVKKLVEADHAVVKHEMREDQVILTAGPEELQGFLLQYADRVFGDKEGDAMVKIAAAEGE
jgi:hypothetical protein